MEKLGKFFRVYSIKVGDVKLLSNDPLSKPQHIRVARMHPHPEYRGRSRFFQNDIAILELESAAKSSDMVTPICLPEASAEPLTGVEFTAIGWGVTSSGKTADVLQQVKLPFVAIDECQKGINWKLNGNII